MALIFFKTQYIDFIRMQLLALVFFLKVLTVKFKLYVIGKISFSNFKSQGKTPRKILKLL